MAAETETLRFVLDDDIYEVPGIEDLDLDEWQIMFDYSGLILDDFAPLDDPDEETARLRRLRTPSFTRALLHIGYRRVNPDAKPDAIRELTGSLKLTRALSAMADAVDDEDDADPPALTSAPEQSSERSSDGSSENGSAASPPSSDEPDAVPATTTTGA